MAKLIHALKKDQTYIQKTYLFEYMTYYIKSFLIKENNLLIFN